MTFARRSDGGAGYIVFSPNYRAHILKRVLCRVVKNAAMVGPDVMSDSR